MPDPIFERLRQRREELFNQLDVENPRFLQYISESRLAVRDPVKQILDEMRSSQDLQLEAQQRGISVEQAYQENASMIEEYYDMMAQTRAAERFLRDTGELGAAERSEIMQTAQESLQRPDLTEEQRAGLQRQIQRLGQQAGQAGRENLYQERAGRTLNMFAGTPIPTDLGRLSDFGRGAARAASSLVTSPARFLMKRAGDVGVPGARESAEELETTIGAALGPSGTESPTARFAGETAGTMVPFGLMARGTVAGRPLGQTIAGAASRVAPLRLVPAAAAGASPAAAGLRTAVRQAIPQTVGTAAEFTAIDPESTLGAAMEPGMNLQERIGAYLEGVGPAALMFGLPRAAGAGVGVAQRGAEVRRLARDMGPRAEAMGLRSPVPEPVQVGTEFAEKPDLAGIQTARRGYYEQRYPDVEVPPGLREQIPAPEARSFTLEDRLKRTDQRFQEMDTRSGRMALDRIDLALNEKLDALDNALSRPETPQSLETIEQIRQQIDMLRTARETARKQYQGGAPEQGAGFREAAERTFARRGKGRRKKR